MARPGQFQFNGSHLRQARRHARLSLHRLSVLMSERGVYVTPETIRHWEIGQHEPRATFLAHLCAILKQRPEWFLTVTGPTRSRA